MVVMAKQDYLKEAHRQLDNSLYYQNLATCPLEGITLEVNQTLLALHEKNSFDKRTLNFLLPSSCRLARFYLLPKLHKLGNPGRPIVSSNNTPTENISSYVDHFLQPLVQSSPNIIRDTMDFLKRLTELPAPEPGWLVVTLDVSCCTQIFPTRRVLKHVVPPLRKEPIASQPPVTSVT